MNATMCVHGVTQVKTKAKSGETYQCLEVNAITPTGVATIDLFFANHEDWKRAKGFFDGLNSNLVDLPEDEEGTAYLAAEVTV